MIDFLAKLNFNELLPYDMILGVVNGARICQTYFSDGIVVLWGSLIMANAVECYGLHKRFAVALLSNTGYYTKNSLLHFYTSKI